MRCRCHPLASLGLENEGIDRADNIFQASQAIQVRGFDHRMERARHRRGSFARTSGEAEGQACHETRQDTQGLRQSCQYVTPSFLESCDSNSCPVTQEMQLKRNIGSDRSWVWTVAADYAEMSPTSETLAIQLANSDSELNINSRLYTLDEHARRRG